MSRGGGGWDAPAWARGLLVSAGALATTGMIAGLVMAIPGKSMQPLDYAQGLIITGVGGWLVAFQQITPVHQPLTFIFLVLVAGAGSEVLVWLAE